VVVCQEKSAFIFLPFGGSWFGGPRVQVIKASLSWFSVAQVKGESQSDNVRMYGKLWENRYFQTMGETWEFMGELGRVTSEAVEP
jgi:hypothetical protein